MATWLWIVIIVVVLAIVLAAVMAARLRGLRGDLWRRRPQTRGICCDHPPELKTRSPRRFDSESSAAFRLAGGNGMLREHRQTRRRRIACIHEHIDDRCMD